MKEKEISVRQAQKGFARKAWFFECIFAKQKLFEVTAPSIPRLHSSTL